MLKTDFVVSETGGSAWEICLVVCTPAVSAFAAHLGPSIRTLSRLLLPPAASQFALLGRNALLAPPLLHPASWSRVARFVVDVATIVMPTIAAPLCSPDKALLFCGACLATAALRRGTLRQTPQLELAHLNEAHPVALTNLRALVMLQVRAPTCADGWDQHSQPVAPSAHHRRCFASSRSTIPSSRGGSQR